MRNRWAERIKKLPPYLFAEIDRLKEEQIANGVDVIDLGVGDPDIQTPFHIVEKMIEAVRDPSNHRYPSYYGMLDFRKAVAAWYKRRFGVTINPESEVISLIGSKEGIAHIPLAFVDPGDIALVPDPGYPVYRVSVVFAGGNPYTMPLRLENGFLPDLSEIPKHIAERTKLMFINYPNNPTTAVAGKDFFKEVVRFADKYGIVVCHDAAYSEIYFDEAPISFLEIDGAKDIGIEFHSLSKTFNMTGWRIGFAVGNADIIKALGHVKTNIDSGVFQAIQRAAIAGLESEEAVVQLNRDIYRRRRDIFINGLKQAGIKIFYPKATFYIWAHIPPGYSSTDFALSLLKKSGIVATPGIGFGSFGEGFIRFSLTINEDRLREASDRISRLIL